MRTQLLFATQTKRKRFIVLVLWFLYTNHTCFKRIVCISIVQVYTLSSSSLVNHSWWRKLVPSLTDPHSLAEII